MGEDGAQLERLNPAGTQWKSEGCLGQPGNKLPN